jgi:hypothetical protein
MIPLLALIAFMLAYGKSEYPFGDTNITSIVSVVGAGNNQTRPPMSRLQVIWVRGIIWMKIWRICLATHERPN